MLWVFYFGYVVDQLDAVHKQTSKWSKVGLHDAKITVSIALSECHSGKLGLTYLPNFCHVCNRTKANNWYSIPIGALNGRYFRMNRRLVNSYAELLSAAIGQRPTNYLSCCCCSCSCYFPFISFPL